MAVERAVVAVGAGGTSRLICAYVVRAAHDLSPAAARTYALAARLPAVLLDALLNVPYLLASARNALLPVPPRVPVAPPAPAPAPGPAAVPPQAPVAEKAQESTDSDREHSETGSEADVESNEGGYGSGVGESWISLKSRPGEPGA